MQEQTKEETLNSICNRKFDPVKEQPDDFLTDLQRLANLAIVDDPAAHIDRTDERTRRIREQFIQGMPFK